MSTLKRLRELSGLRGLFEKDEPVEPTTTELPTPEEDVDGDGAVAPEESSTVQTASDDIAKAKVHIKNIEKLDDTIRNDVGKYVAKIEKHVIDEYGGLSKLSDIDPLTAKKIMGYFNKLHSIVNTR